MKVLPLPNSLSNLQKCYFPIKYFAEIGVYFNKYVILELDSKHCVAQLYFRTDLHESYCNLDATVTLSADLSSNSVFYKTLDCSNVIPLDGPLEAKCVYVSIIFENLANLVEWKKKINTQQILFDVLKLFGIYSGCSILLDKFNEYFQLGISLVTINSIEIRGKNKNHNLSKTVAKLVSSSNIIIDYESTRTMTWLKRPSDIGGFQEPYKLLKETLLQSRMLEGSAIHQNKNVILIGPSGCGKKTLVAKVANDCGALLIEINGAEILCPKDGRGRPGEVEDNIRKSFGLIKTLCEQYMIKDNFNKSLTSKRKSVVKKNYKDVHHSPSTMIILLLSQLELMCPNRKRGIGKGLVGQTTQLCSVIEDLKELDNLLVFATTSNVDDLDPSIRRPGRLDKEVFIGIPTEEERTLILEKLIPNIINEKKGAGDSSVKALARSAAALTPGRVAADLCLLCQEVNRMRFMRKLSANLDPENISQTWLGDFAHCAAKLPVSTLLEGPGTLISNVNSPQDKRPCLSSICGLGPVKNRLCFSVKEPLMHPEAFKLLGVKPPKGVLLYGPPGCAKTTLARALVITDSQTHKHSVEPSITFLSSSAAELYSPYVGESERKVVDLFQRARAGSPSIVFIDELDALFGSREGMQKGGVQERVLSALLTEMDGVGHRLVAPTASSHGNEGDQIVIGAKENAQFHEKYYEEKCISNDSFPLVIVIAATNRPDLIDEALLRPGRLDQLIFIPPPCEDARLEILSYYTANMPILGDKESILWNLASKTELYSGADLKNLCKEAALFAISEEGFAVKELQEKHFLTALKSVRPSLSSDQILSYENFSRNKFVK